MFQACRSGKLRLLEHTTASTCGIQATGRRVSVPLMGFFLFDKTTGHLNAERIYFDNNTILAQIRGEMSPDDVFDLGRIEHGESGSTLK